MWNAITKVSLIHILIKFRIKQSLFVVQCFWQVQFLEVNKSIVKFLFVDRVGDEIMISNDDDLKLMEKQSVYEIFAKRTNFELSEQEEFLLWEANCWNWIYPIPYK